VESINENKKKNKWNAIVINRLAQKHGFTKYYIRQCLRRDRNNNTADIIRREYRELVLKVEQALQ